MKNKFQLIIALLLVVCTLTGCEKDNIDTYSGKNSIYFTWTDTSPLIREDIFIDATDSMAVSFGFDGPNIHKKIFKLPVSIQGVLPNNDRQYKVVVDPQSTAIRGQHYDLPDEYVFHAGFPRDSISIVFYRTPDMKKKSLTLTLELRPNNNFVTNKLTNINASGDTLSCTKFTLLISDIITEPDGWGVYWLGKFSLKKILLMSKVLGVDISIFNEELSLGEMQYYGVIMQRYLNMKISKGETIYEEDGTVMIMGILVQ